jgi:hypothetical protein
MEDQALDDCRRKSGGNSDSLNDPISHRHIVRLAGLDRIDV